MRNIRIIILLILLVFLYEMVKAQEVSITNYAINEFGQVQITVPSHEGYYYVLETRHHPDSAFIQYGSMAMGQEGETIISEPMRAYPSDHYKVMEYPVIAPIDSDADGLDDKQEFDGRPDMSPFNDAFTISSEHGMASVKEESDFHTIARSDNNTPWIHYLDDIEFTKFIIVDFFTDSAQLYFINCNTHPLHEDFSGYMGIDHEAPTVRKGQIMYNPNVLSSNGTLGTYAFNFSSNEIENFWVAQRAFEMIAYNMPFIKNNLSYFLTPNDEELYNESIALYENSRVPVLFETDVYAGINYWGLNQVESYGYFHLMSPGEVPDPKDIVLYETIPNVLPRVGGIITTVLQTPLSHVNLRAKQDNIPNAFIRNALQIDSIASLIGHYIYFRADQATYEIREATSEEVELWYERLRPVQPQVPKLNLSYTSIESLDDIQFDMYDGFGSKTSNLATMRDFGFEEGTIPAGYGIPFFYYHQFMQYNHFFDQISEFISDSAFISDRNVRDSRLAQLRSDIEAAPMPQWMMDSLSALQLKFDAGIGIRCRSSTNNEDLPEFSGAGLYDSKTHRPDEGHLSKTIKEVFASLWNLRAFDEREFYRVNHFYSAMGVLCYPNFDGELVNGVGITTDPVYATENRFYLNSQLGEELVTNPGSSLPEELLLKRFPNGENDIIILQYSSLIATDSLLLSTSFLNQLHDDMSVIHDRFEVLYHAENNSTFAMDIEYKITAENRLIIKQARPWVNYKRMPSSDVNYGECGVILFPNPAHDVVYLGCKDCGIEKVFILDAGGKVVFNQQVNFTDNSLQPLNIQSLQSGLYLVSGFEGSSECTNLRFVKY